MSSLKFISRLFHGISLFSVQHNNTIVDLSNACMTGDLSSLHVPDQPKKLPHGLIYWFDASFAGNQCWSSLKRMIKGSLPGAAFIERRSCRVLSMNRFWCTLHCNRYKCLEISSKKEYAAEDYTPTGICHESIKRTKTHGALSTIPQLPKYTERS